MNGIHSLDVVAFCNQRLDSRAFNEIGGQFPDGVMTQGLPAHLQNGNYIPVLSALWGEGNVERRVDWLRFYTDLHAPLMYELAIAEFEANPTINTVISISLPLIQSATFRTYQDALCSADRSVSDGKVSEEMRATYARVLKRIFETSLPFIDWNETVRNYDTEIFNSTMERLGELTDQIVEDPYNLPSPAWIDSHGLREGPLLPHDPGRIAAIRGRLARNLSRRLEV